jgi:hypothetical protein
LAACTNKTGPGRHDDQALLLFEAFCPDKEKSGGRRFVLQRFS